MGFQRGINPKRALSVGMINVWPEMVKEVESKIHSILSNNTVKILGYQDEEDLEYYIVIEVYSPRMYTTFSINADQNSAWVSFKYDLENKQAKKYGSFKYENSDMFSIDLGNADTIISEVTRIMDLMLKKMEDEILSRKTNLTKS